MAVPILGTQPTPVSTPQRCLVLGGAGFIGSHIVEALLARGHKVCILDKQPSPWWPPPTTCQTFWGDWNDTELLQSAVQSSDVLIHLIATSLPATSNTNIPTDVLNNLNATLKLLEICRTNSIKRIIFSSSGGTVYGPAQFLPITEDHPTHPLNSYGIIKLTIEHYLRLYHQLYGLEYTILRGANPYGERQSPHNSQGAVGVFLGRVAQRKPITIWGDGQVVRDYFHVIDMAQAFVAAVEAPITKGVFNIGSGQGYSLVELLTAIATVTGQEPHIRFESGRPVDVLINVLDIQRAKTILSWQPHISLLDGLSRTWNWIKDQME